jgi:hypothetical protein
MKRSFLKEECATASYTGGAWLSSCPLRPGLHTCYNGCDKKLPVRENELISKHILSSDCRLQLAYMKVESLVIAGQLYCGESVPGPCTHRPSHHGSWLYPKLLS